MCHSPGPFVWTIRLNHSGCNLAMSRLNAGLLVKPCGGIHTAQFFMANDYAENSSVLFGVFRCKRNKPQATQKWLIPEAAEMISVKSFKSFESFRSSRCKLTKLDLAVDPQVSRTKRAKRAFHCRSRKSKQLPA